MLGQRGQLVNDDFGRGTPQRFFEPRFIECADMRDDSACLFEPFCSGVRVAHARDGVTLANEFGDQRRPIAPLAPATKIFISILSMPFQASASQFYRCTLRLAGSRIWGCGRSSDGLGIPHGSSVSNGNGGGNAMKDGVRKRKLGEMGAGSQRAGAGLYGDVGVLWTRRSARIQATIDRALDLGVTSSTHQTSMGPSRMKSWWAARCCRTAARCRSRPSLASCGRKTIQSSALWTAALRMSAARGS